ncbi:sigma-54-dependent Fis family transcriptional regulator, partial [Vibrio vulnificus]
ELANHFLKTYAKEDGKKFNSISKEAQSILKKYNWPGNVRQLQNIIRNIVVLNDDNQLNVEHLPAQLTTKPQTVKEPAKLSTPPQPAQAVVHEMHNGHEALNHHSLETQRSMANPLTHNAFHHSDGSIRPMWQIEREAIQNAIAFCDGNVISAAVMLELSPSTVYRKKQAWEAEENA